ncbi:MAG: glycerol-3-phosphate acyltransferase [Gammaproteobacteria bacterium RIFCSPHIGHO2_12_FULL_41_20]|nr:MAG: glycerol-3-phosphate acyltransferase [Gammaproteobacteria bacterium RIFCSPHIGHO2_12_FULL_41_20]
MNNLDVVAAIIIAYVFGSLSSAIIVCKLMGFPDPRTRGSGNPGTTNVLRIGGKTAAVFTLLGDVLKGVIPVLLARWYGVLPIGLVLVVLAAFLGHLYPVFFRFQGGKGVATALGGIIALAWPVGVMLIATWLFVALCFRYSSLAALISALLAPFYTWYFTNRFYAAVIVLMSMLLIYRHRNNIRNLWMGKESKLAEKI